MHFLFLNHIKPLKLSTITLKINLYEKLKKNITESFDRGSYNYDLNAKIQKKICRKLISFFKNYDNGSLQIVNALEIGCGSGLMTKELVKLKKIEKVHLLDISSEMIKKASSQNFHKNASFEIADFDNFSRYNEYDFIYSNMAIHWSENIENLIYKILLNLSQKGFFIFSIPNSLKFSFEKRNKAESFCSSLVNQFPKYNDIKQILSSENYNHFSKQISLKEIYNRPIDFFFNLKKIGANVSFKKKKSNVFSLRHIAVKTLVSYDIGFFFIQKI